jgi:hypothetical protein
MERIIAENWGVLVSAPLAFLAALCFGAVIGWIVVGLIYNQRLTHYQELIANYRDVLEEKLPVRALRPFPAKHSKQMSIGLIVIFVGVGAVILGALIVMFDKSGLSVKQIGAALPAVPSVVGPNAQNPLPTPVLPSENKVSSQASSSPKPDALPPRDVRELLDALREAQDLDDKHIKTVVYGIENWAANWRGVIRNGNAVITYTMLRDTLKTDVWDRIDSFIDRHQRHQSVLQEAFALDHVAAKNEVSRALQSVVEAAQRLPRNSPPEMDDLLSPQFKELSKQSALLYQWLLEFRRRTSEMIENLNSRGVATYAKR